MFMRRFIFAFALVMASMSGPALALNVCDDLWFTRNLILDRAGYCFTSDLGQAIFDNADCVEGEVALAPRAEALVDLISADEDGLQCRVDDTRTSLDIPDIPTRMLMVDLPIATLYESACVGWLGDSLELRTARNDEAEVIGAAERGDALAFQFQDEGAWSFVEVLGQDGLLGMGWAKVQIAEENCVAIAG
jgi:hypothetical protein